MANSGGVLNTRAARVPGEALTPSPFFPWSLLQAAGPALPDMNPGKTLDLIQKKAMKKGSAKSSKDRNLIRRSRISDQRSQITNYSARSHNLIKAIRPIRSNPIQSNPIR